MFGNDLRRLAQTILWISPAADEQYPMLDNHGDELGIDFAQNPPRLFTPRYVNLSVTFEELEH